MRRRPASIAAIVDSCEAEGQCERDRKHRMEWIDREDDPPRTIDEEIEPC
jgi:hypothetical protein